MDFVGFGQWARMGEARQWSRIHVGVFKPERCNAPSPEATQDAIWSQAINAYKNRRRPKRCLTPEISTLYKTSPEKPVKIKS